MKRGTALLPGLLCLLVLLVAVSARASPVETGVDLLQAKGCLSCHTLDGSASAGPTLNGVVEAKGAEYVRRAILVPNADIAEGYSAGMMPAVPVSEAELEALVLALAVPTSGAEPAEGGSILAVAVCGFLFVFLHLFLSSGWVRPRLVSALGETRFQWLYTTQAIVMLSLTWYAWDLAPFVELWRPAPWTRWVPNIGMPFVCILIWAGYTTESPTIAGKEGALSNERVATGVLRITRHPANMGFILWGLLHLFANGDLATVLLILSFVGLGVLGTWHIERRRLARHGNAWLAYAKETSVVPFAAILRGDQHLAVGEMGWKPIAGGLALWLVLLLTHHHEWFAGKSPMPFF